MLTTFIISFQRIQDFHTMLLTNQLTMSRTFSSIAYELILYKYTSRQKPRKLHCGIGSTQLKT